MQFLLSFRLTKSPAVDFKRKWTQQIKDHYHRPILESYLSGIQFYKVLIGYLEQL